MSIAPLGLIVELIRSEKQFSREVPGFDPQNWNETARFLFVLELPGPKAVASGFISLDKTTRTKQRRTSEHNWQMQV